MVGLAILEHARRLGLGISSFVSLGNKADVSSNDLLERWEDDPATGVIVLYLESFGNPRRFARIARRVGARKPIIAVKGGRGRGRSEADRWDSASPAVALAGSDAAVDALFRQAGVTRCDTLDELFDAAALLAHQPLPAGNRVGILTNVAGLGLLCADACAANGLRVAPLSEATQGALCRLLVSDAQGANPVDVRADAAAPVYGAALRHLLADEAIDAAIVLFIPPLTAMSGDVAGALLAACDAAPSKPVLCCFAGAQGIPDALRAVGNADRIIAIPSYTYPEAAARALGHAAARAAWLRRPAGQVPALADVDVAMARAVVEHALARYAHEDQPWLPPGAVRTMLQAYGIAMPAQALVGSPDEAAEACRRLGAPVAVKLATRRVLRKTDVGGVRLGLTSPAAAAAAYRAIAAELAARGQEDAMEGALVQPMATDGVECLVGVAPDPIFGPLVAFGLGGVTAEIVADIAFRVHPLTDVDAEELIGSVRAARLLEGYGGRPPADVPALRDLLLRVSRMVEDLPEIAEIDINPVMARPQGQGALALDARIRLTRGEG